MAGRNQDWVLIAIICIHYTLNVTYVYKYIIKSFLKNLGRVAEWLALQTGKRGDSSSIPAQVKTFFGGIKSLERYIACLFELD